LLFSPTSEDSKCTESGKVRRVYAVKHIHNAFDRTVQAHRLLREIRLMKILRDHPNIVKLKTIMRP
jgi:serine/threonine protein kinase